MHSTSNCVVFKNVIQEDIDKGLLKFPEKGKENMGIDENSFLTIPTNMVMV